MDTAASPQPDDTLRERLAHSLQDLVDDAEALLKTAQPTSCAAPPVPPI